MFRTLLASLFICLPAPSTAIAENAIQEPAAKSEDSNGHGQDSADLPADKTHPAEEVTGTDAFCDSIIEPARERRYFLKKQELEALLALVTERTAALDKRAAEHKEWIRRREDFAKQATENLVQIYSSMKPEAAAARLSELDMGLAASLLLAITPRQASSILNEMDEKTAADLTGIMSASARSKDPS